VVLDIENNVYLQADTEQMSAAVVEIKKLNDNLSQLRQENIMLKVSETSVHM
jgi:DNA polymerase III sliding clamp (beta) subunit (PCNA family)